MTKRINLCEVQQLRWRWCWWQWWDWNSKSYGWWERLKNVCSRAVSLQCRLLYNRNTLSTGSWKTCMKLLKVDLVSFIVPSIQHGEQPTWGTVVYKELQCSAIVETSRFVQSINQTNTDIGSSPSFFKVTWRHRSTELSIWHFLLAVLWNRVSPESLSIRDVCVQNISGWGLRDVDMHITSFHFL